jgi:hypothetical protein
MSNIQQGIDRERPRAKERMDSRKQRALDRRRGGNGEVEQREEF